MADAGSSGRLRGATDSLALANGHGFEGIGWLDICGRVFHADGRWRVCGGRRGQHLAARGGRPGIVADPRRANEAVDLVALRDRVGLAALKELLRDRGGAIVSGGLGDTQSAEPARDVSVHMTDAEFRRVCDAAEAEGQKHAARRYNADLDRLRAALRASERSALEEHDLWVVAVKRAEKAEKGRAAVEREWQLSRALAQEAQGKLNAATAEIAAYRDHNLGLRSAVVRLSRGATRCNGTHPPSPGACNDPSCWQGALAITDEMLQEALRALDKVGDRWLAGGLNLAARLTEEEKETARLRRLIGTVFNGGGVLTVPTGNAEAVQAGQELANEAGNPDRVVSQRLDIIGNTGPSPSPAPTVDTTPRCRVQVLGHRCDSLIPCAAHPFVTAGYPMGHEFHPADHGGHCIAKILRVRGGTPEACGVGRAPHYPPAAR